MTPTQYELDMRMMRRRVRLLRAALLLGGLGSALALWAVTR